MEIIFCPKCGTKASDDAAFCQKCGAKLSAGDTEKQAPASTPAQQTQIQNGASGTPKKKKSKKLSIIIGAVVLALAVIIIAASSGQDGVTVGASVSNDSTAASLSETNTIAAAEDTSGGNEAENLNTVDVNYEGVPLSQLVQLSAEEVIALLGPPEIHDEYKLAYDAIEFNLDGGRITGAESFSPEKFLIGGTPLAQNRSLLPSLLGEPTQEGEGGSGYEMTFEQNGYALTIATDGKDGAAWRILIAPKVETGTENQAGGEILYKGHPVKQLLGSTPEELNQIFGAPTGGTPVTGEMLYGATEFYTYGGISFMLGDQGTVVNIVLGADAAEVNGVTLNRNRAEIINLLGTPWSEEQLPEDESGEGLGGDYVMEYSVYDGGIITTTTIRLPDANSIAEQVVMNQSIDEPDGGSGDEEYQTSSNKMEGHPSAYTIGGVFIDLYNQTGGNFIFSEEGWMQNVDNQAIADYYIEGDNIYITDTNGEKIVKSFELHDTYIVMGGRSYYEAGNLIRINSLMGN